MASAAAAKDGNGLAGGMGRDGGGVRIGCLGKAAKSDGELVAKLAGDAARLEGNTGGGREGGTDERAASDGGSMGLVGIVTASAPAGTTLLGGGCRAAGWLNVWFIDDINGAGGGGERRCTDSGSRVRVVSESESQLSLATVLVNHTAKSNSAQHVGVKHATTKITSSVQYSSVLVALSIENSGHGNKSVK